MPQELEGPPAAENTNALGTAPTELGVPPRNWLEARRRSSDRAKFCLHAIPDSFGIQIWQRTARHLTGIHVCPSKSHQLDFQRISTKEVDMIIEIVVLSLAGYAVANFPFSFK